MPDLHGTYFYSDICSALHPDVQGRLGRRRAEPGRTGTADVAPGGGLSIGGVSSFGEDARGEIYIVDYGGGGDGQGEVYRLVPEAEREQAVDAGSPANNGGRSPRRLSQPAPRFQPALGVDRRHAARCPRR